MSFQLRVVRTKPSCSSRQDRARWPSPSFPVKKEQAQSGPRRTMASVCARQKAGQHSEHRHRHLPDSFLLPSLYFVSEEASLQGLN